MGSSGSLRARLRRLDVLSQHVVHLERTVPGAGACHACRDERGAVVFVAHGAEAPPPRTCPNCRRQIPAVFVIVPYMVPPAAEPKWFLKGVGAVALWALMVGIVAHGALAATLNSRRPLVPAKLARGQESAAYDAMGPDGVGREHARALDRLRASRLPAPGALHRDRQLRLPVRMARPAGGNRARRAQWTRSGA